MDRPRFSLAWLLAMVVHAVALASMRTASTSWNALATMVTLGLLGTDVVADVSLRGPGRASWAGFAIFGWVYLVCIDRDWNGTQIDHGLTGSFSDVDDPVYPSPPLRRSARSVEFPPHRDWDPPTSLNSRGGPARSVTSCRF